VRNRDDRRRAGMEKARVRIAAATAGTTVAGRGRAWLVVRASDRRPGGRGR
jgi:hypothetical protein